MIKKLACICILVVLVFAAGCFRNSNNNPTPTPTPTQTESPSPTPSKHPDIWSDTKVFGMVLNINDDNLDALVAEELRQYKLTDNAKECIEGLEIVVGDEVAIDFETDSEGNYTAISIEKVMTR